MKLSRDTDVLRALRSWNMVRDRRHDFEHPQGMDTVIYSESPLPVFALRNLYLGVELYFSLFISLLLHQ